MEHYLLRDRCWRKGGVAARTMTAHLWINNGRINCLKEKNLDERKFIALQNANLLHCKKLLFELIVE